jgi:uncharacterized damage-inducible protein DinB
MATEAEFATLSAAPHPISEAPMEFSIDQSIALLARTPATLNALLRDLPQEWTHANEGPSTWSAFDVVGHLIHGEQTDWLVRTRLILEHGESRPFDKFDREAQFRLSAGKSLPQLLDEFTSLRAENIAALRALNLQPEQLALRGRHPALGTVTLAELLATWAVHDMTHLHQVARILAHQYRDSVGPWEKYLGVLQCTGHSA